MLTDALSYCLLSSALVLLAMANHTFVELPAISWRAYIADRKQGELSTLQDADGNAYVITPLAGYDTIDEGSCQCQLLGSYKIHTRNQGAQAVNSKRAHAGCIVDTATVTVAVARH